MGIDVERSHEFEREISHGCEGIKPGWTRVNFNYFISEAVFEYLVTAVHLVAEFGHRLLPLYRFEASSGLWQHRIGAVEPPLRLGQLHYDADGRLTYPVHHDRASEAALGGYLDSARELFDSLAEPELLDAVPGGSVDFEQLRWFEVARH